MSGLSDIHTALVLQDRWRDVYSTLAKFRALFTGVPDSVVDQWHAKLAPSTDYLRFGTAFSTENPSIPQVVVHAEDEPVDVAPLGYQGVNDTNFLTDTNSMYIRETATLTIYGSSSELARALHVMCRSALLGSVPWFLGVGYDHVEYLGGGGLEQEDSLLPEELGVYIRTQRWSFTSLMQAETGKMFEHSTVVVAHEDATVDGESGGASAWLVEGWPDNG